MLRTPTSPGFIVKDGFLGATSAAAIRDAARQLTQSKPLHAAGVGSGAAFRQEQAVRGDRIHWIERDDKALDPAFAPLFRAIEKLVYGASLD